jgi:hypothetical protein
MEAASPPLCFLACRACYGSVHPASRLLRIACGDGLKAGLDPGASASPGGRKSGQARACPRHGARHAAPGTAVLRSGRGFRRIRPWP